MPPSSDNATRTPPRPSPLAVASVSPQKLADAVVDYIAYQHEAGAQVVQVFDSWAAQLR